MRNELFLIIAICLFFSQLNAQNDPNENLEFDRIIENLLPQQEIEVDYNDLYDRLFTLYENPLNLNTATRNDFQSLFILSEEQISGILNYRKNFGNSFSVYELVSINGFDKETVEKLTPLITIHLDPEESLKASLKNPDIDELILRYQTTLEQKKSYLAPDTSLSGRLTSRYAGDPSRVFGRFLYAVSGKYSVGMTIEKDPGEQLIWESGSSRYGMDYYSFHAMIENIGVFKKIIIGDFSMDLGQGLIFGSGIRLGKGTAPIVTVRKNNLGLRPYCSVYENKDFSGIAISTKIRPVELNIFYSYVRKDAILREDSSDVRDQYISYIQTIGLHRTPSEILAKHSFSDETLGANISFKSKNLNKKFEIGFNELYTRYSVPLFPNIKKYNQFEFVGLTNKIGSLYLNAYYKNVHACGETVFLGVGVWPFPRES